MVVLLITLALRVRRLLTMTAFPLARWCSATAGVAAAGLLLLRTMISSDSRMITKLNSFICIAYAKGVTIQ